MVNEHSMTSEPSKDGANDHATCCEGAHSPSDRLTDSPSQAVTPSAPLKGKEYWRSLDELADTPEFREFVAHEFPAGATEMLNSADRREFLKIMGASLAFAGMGAAGSGCRRWPEEKIAPYAHRPPGHND